MHLSVLSPEKVEQSHMNAKRRQNELAFDPHSADNVKACAAFLALLYDTSLRWAIEHVVTAIRPMEEEAPTLLSLPREVRNVIYHHVLTIKKRNNNTITISHHRIAKRHSVLVMLQSCQQIRIEAEGIFYSMNDLGVVLSEISRFVATLSSKRLRAIQRFGIWDIENRIVARVAVRMLQPLPKLTRLHFCMKYCNLDDLFSLLHPAELMSFNLLVIQFHQLRKIRFPGPRGGYLKERMKHGQTLMEKVEQELQHAIVCGRITRMIRNAWRSGEFNLKTVSYEPSVMFQW